jgi:polyphosphate kinase 2 (PPK2 family)
LITDAFGKRMEQIRNFEKHITENGTIVLKFFHISGRSRGTFIEAFRRKNTIGSSQWGFEERERWDDYMQYYEEAINNTSTDYIWYVIPPTIKKCALYCG